MSDEKSKELIDLYVKKVIHKYNPKFKIKNKSESKLFKILKPILKLINPKFFDDYITTMFGTMWVTNTFYEKRPIEALAIVAHEGVHEYDRKRFPLFVFELLYMSPQWFSLIFLILAIFHSWWWLIATIIFLGPLPSPGRFYLEMRGYATEKLWSKYFYTNDWDPNEFIVFQLSNIRTYWGTWPFKKNIRKKLKKPVDENEKVYKDMLDFVRKYGYLKN
jgi:hypothetical protein